MGRAIIGIAMLAGTLALPPFRGGSMAAGEDLFFYDLSPYRKTESSLIRYREELTIPLGTRELGGVAVEPSGRILVAAGTDLLFLDGRGRSLGKASLGEAATCIAAGKKGEIVVGFARRVEVLNPSGVRVAAWEDLGEKSFLTSLAAWRDEVFLADFGNRVVWRFDRSGRLLGQIGRKDPAEGHPGFILPSPFFDLAMAGDGTLWVANSGMLRVEHFTREGRFLSSWGKASLDADGFAGCCNPSHIALTPEGAFVTSEKGIPRVKVYSPEGTLTAVVAGPEQFSPEAVDLDLAVDSAGRVLVLDPRAGALRIFVRFSADGGRKP